MTIIKILLSLVVIFIILGVVFFRKYLRFLSEVEDEEDKLNERLSQYANCNSPRAVKRNKI